MPTTSIPVLPFLEALARYPDAGYAPYNRVSSWGQAGPGVWKLKEKTDAMFAEARATVPFRLLHVPFFGVEEGKLTGPRPTLEAAIGWARKRRERLILVASDLSRFIRAGDYHRVQNPDAWPTDEEFARLRETTRRFVLATLLDPHATEGERHAAATRRTGRAGRPHELDHVTACSVLRMLGPSRRSLRGRAEWDVPLSVVAREHGVTKSIVQRFLDRPVSRGGARWKDLDNPYEVYRDLFGASGVEE